MQQYHFLSTVTAIAFKLNRGNIRNASDGYQGVLVAGSTSSPVKVKGDVIGEVVQLQLAVEANGLIDLNYKLQSVTHSL